MKKISNQLLRSEYANGTWAFIDPVNPTNRITFDQALIDVTSIQRHRVEGYVKSVHGINAEISDLLSPRTRSDIGITGIRKLGRVGTMKRVRLMPDGTVEDAT